MQIQHTSHTGRGDFEFLTCANNLLTKIDYLQNRCDLQLDFVNLTAPHTLKITHHRHIRTYTHTLGLERKKLMAKVELCPASHDYSIASWK